MRGDGHCQWGLMGWIKTSASPLTQTVGVDGLEQDLCHPLPEMYAMPEGEEWPPTARDGVLSDGEPVQRTAYTEVGSCEWECRSGAHES